uniref:Uncharacterized protein n=1 Tax=Arundo donax TaxID=35708 RepID=A0A0A9HBJ9_ARUDO
MNKIYACQLAAPPLPGQRKGRLDLGIGKSKQHRERDADKVGSIRVSRFSLCNHIPDKGSKNLSSYWPTAAASH